MLTKNELKYFTSLQQKKYRDGENKFIAEGRKTIAEGLKSGYKCEVIITSHDFIDKTGSFFNEPFTKGVRKEIVTENEFNKVSDQKNPEGALAIFEKKQFNKEAFFGADNKLAVYLDKISDPGNIGTILRNCDWFGIDNVFVSAGSCEVWNPKVIRGSMGSLFHLNIFTDTNIAELNNELTSAGFEILVSDIEGEEIKDLDLSGKYFLTLSSESHGPSDDLKQIDHHKITIPRLGEAESLNVASASAVLLAALTRTI